MCVTSWLKWTKLSIICNKVLMIHLPLRAFCTKPSSFYGMSSWLDLLCLRERLVDVGGVSSIVTAVREMQDDFRRRRLRGRVGTHK